MTIAINNGRKAETPVPANDRAATGATESVESVATELLEHVNELGLDLNGFSAARAQGGYLAKGKNIALLVPYLAGVLDRGNDHARAYAGRLRETAGLKKSETQNVDDIKVQGARKVDAAPSADPVVCKLAEIAQHFEHSLSFVTVKDTWQTNIAELAHKILYENDRNIIIQYSEELAACLKTGNSDAQEIATEIIDLLQLRLPGVADPEQAEPAAPKKQATATELKDKLTVQPVVSMMPVDDIVTREPFSTLFTTRPDTIKAIVEDMKEHGFDPSVPLVVWTEQGVLVDGHTRRDAAKEAGIKVVPVCNRSFASEDEAIQYAVHVQGHRRNLTDAEILHLMEVFDKRRKRGGDRKSVEAKSITASAVFAPSSADTAKLIGTSPTKVEKARAISDSKNETLKAEVASGKKSINKAAAEARAEKHDREKTEDANTKAYRAAARLLKQAVKVLRPVDPNTADAIERIIKSAGFGEGA